MRRIFFWLSAIVITGNSQSNELYSDRFFYFTSTDALIGLLRSETKLLSLLDDYIDGEYGRLEQVRRFSNKFRQHNDETISCHGNRSAVVYQRNMFALTKRLLVDLGRTTERIKAEPASLKPAAAVKKVLIFPTNRDLHGAAEALFRLQDTYNVSASDLASGRIYPGMSSEALSADACFSLGYIAYMEHRDYYHSLIWTMEAFKRLSREKQRTVDEAVVLDFLSNSLFVQGNKELALFVARLLRQRHFPRYDPIYNSLEAFEVAVRWSGKDPSALSITEADLSNFANRRGNDPRMPDRDHYEALCRRENQDFTNSHLHCYFQVNHPFLILSPLKVEVMRREEPRLLVYRQFISDHESEVLRDTAEPKFYTTESFLDFRVSKSAWLSDDDHAVVKTISKRIELMTDLTTATAETLHYREEDGERFEQFKTLGNRIATVLLYLSQPRAGGATVFTDVDVALQATKNDAAFWYNLKHTGKGDESTRHAACPVLIGSKWIANKWLHERGQEFRRPCRLQND